MNSEIILCDYINLDKDYTNVLNYTEEQMVALCRQKQVVNANDYSFIRAYKNTIAVNFSYSACLNSSYMAFQNKDYSGKWFFAFIDEVEYRNDGCTYIHYTIDAWSTWYTWWKVQPCFVTREHVNNDTIGLHTVNENLDVGDVIQLADYEDNSYKDFEYIGIMTSWNPSTKSQYSGISVYNKSVFGKEIFLFNIANLSSFSNVALFLIATNGDGHINDIDTIFYIPSAIIKPSELVLYQGNVGEKNYSFYGMNYSRNPEIFNTVINKPYAFADYQPKNNKCLCYPYNYLLVSNNCRKSNYI